MNELASQRVACGRVPFRQIATRGVVETLGFMTGLVAVVSAIGAVALIVWIATGKVRFHARGR